MARFLLILRRIAGLAVTPVVLFAAAILLALTDMAWWVAGRRRRPVHTLPNRESASVVIPNWNGRDLLEKYLPSVLEALRGHPNNEVIVVDNGSSDGSAELVRARFPEVRLLALDRNLGFGGGSNLGFREAKNDIVVLLNSDMRVAPDFLRPLLDCFDAPDVFGVGCQIFFSDPNKVRQETGLTQSWWQDGVLRVRHRLDETIHRPFPAAYPGGGSSAFDRRKFLELGGFDELLTPFYFEDTDIGYLAWKRGWRCLFQPASHVWHEHRGTIGKKFSTSYIQTVLEQNLVLWTWKNIHSPRFLVEHLAAALPGAMLSLFSAPSLERVSLRGCWAALRRAPAMMASRWRARTLSVIGDEEAFRLPRPGYYRDRYEASGPAPERPSVLFLSPYPLEPPVHGGAVFMTQTVRELSRHADLHLIILTDTQEQAAQQNALRAYCRSLETVVRLQGEERFGSLRPHAVREFHSADLEWLIDRVILAEKIDVLQLEYTNMGQYAGEYRHLLNCVFEHDVYFQSIARGLRRAPGRASAWLEYFRALRWELSMLRRVDRIQVCTSANAEYLLSFDRSLDGKLDAGLRAGITAAHYAYRPAGRRANEILFLGSFRHSPNLEALLWFSREVMPLIHEQRPLAKLVAIGSDPPPLHALPALDGAIELRGFVADIHAPLAEAAVFVCPILTGSGVRVKLLEAFASGIPVVSTRIGAEGLAAKDGEFCRLADDPAAFARCVIEQLDAPDLAMVERARREVEANWDMPAITAKLAESYRRHLRALR